MKYFTNADLTRPDIANGAAGYPIFPYGTAPCSGCCAGLNYYFSADYPAPGLHDDNEGFYVISGTGSAIVGDEETDIRPGTFFYAPAGVKHAIRKAPESEPLQIVLFHFPATK